MGDKLHSREGNSPDHQLRSPSYAKWKRMWKCPDNQDVGLEAATIERVRNSSLVEWFCAENVTGLKRSTEAMAWYEDTRGRGAFYSRRRLTGRLAGEDRRENAGMSMRKDK